MTAAEVIAAHISTLAPPQSLTDTAETCLDGVVIVWRAVERGGRLEWEVRKVGPWWCT